VDKNLHPSAPVAHNKLARVGILTALKQGTLSGSEQRTPSTMQNFKSGRHPSIDLHAKHGASHFIFKCRRRVRFSRASAFNSFKNHVIISMNVFLSKLSTDVEELLKGAFVIAHDAHKYLGFHCGLYWPTNKIFFRLFIIIIIYIIS
jgi:hypothetical protein